MGAAIGGADRSKMRCRTLAASPGSTKPRANVLADEIGVFLAVVRSLGRGVAADDVASAEFDYSGLTSRYVSRVHRDPPHLSETSR